MHTGSPHAEAIRWHAPLPRSSSNDGCSDGPALVVPVISVVAARVQVICATALVQPPAFFIRVQIEVVESVECRVTVRVQRRGLRAGVRAPLLRTRRPQRQRAEPVRHEGVAGPAVQGDAAWCGSRLLSADAGAAVTAIRAGLDA